MEDAPYLISFFLDR